MEHEDPATAETTSLKLKKWKDGLADNEELIETLAGIIEDQSIREFVADGHGLQNLLAVAPLRDEVDDVESHV